MTRLVLLAGLVGCARPALPAASPSDVERARVRWPDLTLAELDRGRTLYRARCSTCHLPPAPSQHAAEDWPDLVAAMSERSHLSTGEETAIERYVVALAMASRRGAP